MRILPVAISDAEEILTIYGPYVRQTAITFEYEVPSVEEFRERIRTTSAKYPYLKAVDDESGEILGYAYAGTFKGRAAYDWSVETTVYVRMDLRGGGIGSALYLELEARLRRIGVLNMNACITLPREENPYSTMDSFHFHEKMGFVQVGTFHCSGFKFGLWHDMTWMEKMLGEHQPDTEPVRFGEWR